MWLPDSKSYYERQSFSPPKCRSCCRCFHCLDPLHQILYSAYRVVHVGKYCSLFRSFHSVFLFLCSDTIQRMPPVFAVVFGGGNRANFVIILLVVAIKIVCGNNYFISPMACWHNSSTQIRLCTTLNQLYHRN